MAKAGPAPRRGFLAAPRWQFLVSPPWLAWHAFAVVAFWGMFWLGDWQLHRALAGNSLSWAYTFEWPLFAIMGAVFWAKTIRDEFRIRSGTVTGATESAEGRRSDAAEPGLPLGANSVDGAAATAGSTTGGAGKSGTREAAAYDAYVARLKEEVKGHGRWHGFR
jgi:hypothetical protein